MPTQLNKDRERFQEPPYEPILQPPTEPAKSVFPRWLPARMRADEEEGDDTDSGTLNVEEPGDESDEIAEPIGVLQQVSPPEPEEAEKTVSPEDDLSDIVGLPKGEMEYLTGTRGSEISYRDKDMKDLLEVPDDEKEYLFGSSARGVLPTQREIDSVTGVESGKPLSETRVRESEIGSGNLDDILGTSDKDSDDELSYSTRGLRPSQREIDKITGMAPKTRTSSLRISKKEIADMEELPATTRDKLVGTSPEDARLSPGEVNDISGMTPAATREMFETGNIDGEGHSRPKKFRYIVDGRRKGKKQRTVKGSASDEFLFGTKGAFD